MKREKFLWPLTGGHHEALMVCRNIRTAAAIIHGDGAGNALAELAVRVQYFFKNRLMPHFQAEEKLMETLGNHLGGGNEDIQRLFEEHLHLKALLREGSLESLEIFSAQLTAHIHFEETRLFPLLEKNLTSGEKQEAALDSQKNLAPQVPIESGREARGA